MKKDTLYFLTFTSICIVVSVITFFSVNNLAKISTNKLIATQIESGKRESSEIAVLISSLIDKGVSMTDAKVQIQNMISESNSETGFISVFDWSGKIICHPDITQLNLLIRNSEQTFTNSGQNYQTDELYDVLIESNDEDNSKIMNIVPIKNSNWIAASNLNINQVSNHYKSIKRSFYLNFLLMAVTIIVLSFFVIRFIGVRYEKELELKNKTLQDELIKLSNINKEFINRNENISQKENKLENTISESDNKRLLTNRKNEIVPILTDDIAYVYTKNTITYIVCKNGQKTTITDSLDEILKKLDSKLYFRANRKFIIENSSIDKIIKYGNSQLKIITKPECIEDIIISKNKASAFKRWLNK